MNFQIWIFENLNFQIYILQIMQFCFFLSRNNIFSQMLDYISNKTQHLRATYQTEESNYTLDWAIPGRTKRRSTVDDFPCRKLGVRA